MEEESTKVATAGMLLQVKSKVGTLERGAARLAGTRARLKQGASRLVRGKCCPVPGAKPFPPSSRDFGKRGLSTKCHVYLPKPK